MNNVSLNELAALQLVLKYVSLKDLLTQAMHGFAQIDTIKARDNADICSKAIDSFLS